MNDEHTSFIRKVKFLNGSGEPISDVCRFCVKCTNKHISKVVWNKLENRIMQSKDKDRTCSKCNKYFLFREVGYFCDYRVNGHFTEGITSNLCEDCARKVIPKYLLEELCKTKK